MNGTINEDEFKRQALQLSQQSRQHQKLWQWVDVQLVHVFLYTTIA